ncbi:endophilin-B1-like [Parambassis ranga]|uniref:Endophilin-B1-like n=1 Tax=Parambassis ranga TaxID=210632 RepID=A0A6P7HBG7_9TELE|nr:endophilin-B1-like [Parambassis ranga]
MDLTRLAVDAGQFINRAVQYAGESLGQAEKTEFDPGLEALLARADATKTWTDQIIAQTEVLLQPSPGARLEDRLYERLEWSVPPRPRAHELLGDEMTQAGLEIGSNSPYGMALVRCGEAQKQLGEAERKFVQSTNIHFLTPLRSFTEGEYRAIQNEQKLLVNKRLDLDIAKTRLRKAHEAEREAGSLNANPLDDDYLSHVSFMFSFLRVKWLKIWAQEIAQAEMELRICQSLFDRQSEITRRVLEGISNTQTKHMQSLVDFVEAQSCYFAQCNQHAQELQKQLASIPAVLCSNNWQSALNNAVNQPSTSNHVANEPVGLNQVTPMPVVVHQLPDFNQDSWTIASPIHQSDKNATDSSTNQTNNNNNNNYSFLTDGQAAAPAANQAVEAPNPTDAQELTSSASISSGAITTVASQAVNAAATETVTANGTDQLPVINGGHLQESSSSSRD